MGQQETYLCRVTLHGDVCAAFLYRMMGANHARCSVFGHHVGLRYACAAIVIISSCHIPHIVFDLSFMKYNYESLCLSLHLSAFLFLFISFFHFSFCFIYFFHCCKPFYMVVNIIIHHGLLLLTIVCANKVLLSDYYFILWSSL